MKKINKKSKPLGIKPSMAAVGFLSLATRLFSQRSHHSRRESPSSTPPARQFFLPPRCSGEAAPELVSTEDGAPSSTSEIPVETPRRTHSLISTINVQKAIRGIEITNVDHYGRLGIGRGDSYDKALNICSIRIELKNLDWVAASFSNEFYQFLVNLAYQKMCEEVMIQGLDEEEANKRLNLLQESYGILSSEEERRLYDWSLARNEMPDRYVWPFEVDITQTPTQPPPPPEPEDVEPTRQVGYFFLGWFVISVILSVALNR